MSYSYRASRDQLVSSNILKKNKNASSALARARLDLERTMMRDRLSNHLSSRSTLSVLEERQIYIAVPEEKAPEPGHKHNPPNMNPHDLKNNNIHPNNLKNFIGVSKTLNIEC